MLNNNVISFENVLKGRLAQACHFTLYYFIFSFMKVDLKKHD